MILLQSLPFPIPVSFGPQYKAGLTFTIDTNDVLDGETVSLASLSLVEGDMVIVGIAETANNASAPTISSAGWTQLHSAFGNDTYDVSLRFYYKFMGPTPDTSFTTTAKSVIGDAVAGVVQAFSGVDPLDPFASAISVSTQIDTNRPKPPDVNPSTDSALIVCLSATGSLTAGSVIATSDLDNFTVSRDVDAAGYDVMIGMGSRSWAAVDGLATFAQFTGPTNNAVSSSCANIAIALRPLSAIIEPVSGIELVGYQTGALGAAAADYPFKLFGSSLDYKPREGDFVVVLTQSGAYIAVNTAGYTLQTSQFGNDTFRTYQRVYTKVMGATPDTLVNIAAKGSEQGSYLVMVFRGVDITTPLDVAIAGAAGADTKHFNPPAVTPITPGALLVFGGGWNNGGGGGSAANPGDSEQLVQAIPGGNQNICGAIDFYSGWVSGAYDPVAFTNNDNNTFGGWTAFTMALRPA